MATDAPPTMTYRALAIPRRFTRPGVHPYDEVAWGPREAVIVEPARDDRPEREVFRQDDCEFPLDWSDTAVRIVASKYFRYGMDDPRRERSLRQVIDRVVETIRHHGLAGGYFADDDEAETFAQELRHILVTQKAAFNSPVWFNCGVDVATRESRPRPDPRRGRPAGRPRRAAGQPGLGLLHPLGQRHDAVDPALDRLGVGDLPRRLGRRASTCRACAATASRCRTAARRRGRSASCAGPTPAPARSSPAAARGAPRRWSSSTPTTPTSSSSSAPRRTRSRRPTPSARWATTSGLNGDAWRSIQFQNANNSVRLTDDFFRRVEAGEPWQTRTVAGRRAGRRDARGRPAARDLRGRLGLRRPRRPVRGHDPALAHQPERRPHLGLQPVQRVHAHRRLGLQPGVDQPHGVPRRRRGVRG